MDRFFRGLISGIGGGILMNIWSFAAYHLLKLADLRYVDWAAVVIYGRLPSNIWETAFALGSQLLWVGFLGIILAYLIPQVTSRGFLLKGAFWGFLTGFLIYGLAIAFRLPHMKMQTFGTTLSHFIGGIVWGATAAQILALLDKKPRLKT